MSEVHQKKKTGPKPGRENETKLTATFRMYHSDRVKIEQRYSGSIQKFLDAAIERELKEIDAEVDGNPPGEVDSAPVNSHD